MGPSHNICNTKYKVLCDEHCCDEKRRKIMYLYYVNITRMFAISRRTIYLTNVRAVSAVATSLSALCMRCR